MARDASSDIEDEAPRGLGGSADCSESADRGECASGGDGADGGVCTDGAGCAFIGVSPRRVSRFARWRSRSDRERAAVGDVRRG